jgi:hypothetical protein
MFVIAYPLFPLYAYASISFNEKSMAKHAHLNHLMAMGS